MLFVVLLGHRVFESTWFCQLHWWVLGFHWHDASLVVAASPRCKAERSGINAGVTELACELSTDFHELTPYVCDRPKAHEGVVWVVPDFKATENRRYSSILLYGLNVPR